MAEKSLEQQRAELVRKLELMDKLEAADAASNTYVMSESAEKLPGRILNWTGGLGRFAVANHPVTRLATYLSGGKQRDPMSDIKKAVKGDYPDIDTLMTEAGVPDFPGKKAVGFTGDVLTDTGPIFLKGAAKLARVAVPRGQAAIQKYISRSSTSPGQLLSQPPGAIKSLLTQLGTADSGKLAKFIEAPVQTTLRGAGKGMYKNALKPLDEALEGSTVMLSPSETLWNKGQTFIATRRSIPKILEKVTKSNTSQMKEVEHALSHGGARIDLSDAWQAASNEGKRQGLSPFRKKAVKSFEATRAEMPTGPSGYQGASDALETVNLLQDDAKAAYSTAKGLEAGAQARMAQKAAQAGRGKILQAIESRFGSDVSRGYDKLGRETAGTIQARASAEKMAGAPNWGIGTDVILPVGAGLMSTSPEVALKVWLLSRGVRGAASPATRMNTGRIINWLGNVPESVYRQGAAQHYAPWEE